MHTAQNLVPHDYIKSCTVYTVVQQYVLVGYCCFHPTSVASTAVGSYTIPRNRKGFFLSQSSFREKFVEKKFQVFDIVGPLIILVQVNLSSPVERVSKSWNFGVSKRQHRCGVCLKFCTSVVYKNDHSSAFLPGCACVHLPAMTPRVKTVHSHTGFYA